MYGAPTISAGHEAPLEMLASQSEVIRSIYRRQILASKPLIKAPEFGT